MTISSTVNRVSYSGNGSTTAFSFGYLFFSNADLKVILVVNSTGAETTKTITTHYTITGAGDASGGTVTMGTAPASGETLVIIREVGLTQGLDLVENDAFPSDLVEQELDRATMMAQQINTEVDRSFKLSDGDTSGVDTTLPTPVALKTFRWNAGLTALEEADDPGAATTAAAASAVTASTKADEAVASAATAVAYAVKVDGAAAGSDHSSKAWAVGGTGITDTSSKGAAKEWASNPEDDTVAGAGTFSALHYSAKATAQATLATNYATKINGAVTGSDFSSKAWAVGGTNVTSTGSRGAAKEWATTTGAAVDTSEFSSKEYALGTTLTTGSSKQWALGGGSSFTEGTAVAGGVFSAKKYAANAAASASVAASGQIYSTVVNQTGAAISPALSADGTYYLCDTSSNNITVTLPAIGTSEGVKYAFQKTSASNSLIFARSGTDTLNGSASNITLTDVNAQIQFVSDDNSPDNWVGVNLSQITVGTGLTKTGSVVAIDQTHLKQTIAIACGDEVTATAAGTAVVTFHMPYAFTLTGVKAGVTTAPVGSVLTVDINEAGSTVLTTKLTIDAGEKTSGTAATAAVIGGAGPALADNALMTIDVDGVGSSTAGAGLKVYLIGYAT